MTFLGMGSLEVLVVLLISFIVLGPEKLIGIARMLGKLTGDVRRLTRDFPELIIDEGQPKGSEGSVSDNCRDPSSQSDSLGPDIPDPDCPIKNDDGPVEFQSSTPPHPKSNTPPEIHSIDDQPELR